MNTYEITTSTYCDDAMRYISTTTTANADHFHVFDNILHLHDIASNNIACFNSFNSIVLVEKAECTSESIN